MSKFDELFEERIRPLLMDPDTFHESIAALQGMMPEMETKEDRGQVYFWLGTIYKSLAAVALEDEDEETARELFASTEEHLLLSVEEDPMGIEARLSLARLYLSFGSNFPDALAILELSIPEDPVGAGLWELFYEHQRLGLRALSLALLDRGAESAQAFEAAYNEKFKGQLRPDNIDLSPLVYLARRGVRFTPDSAKEILDRLQRMGLEPERMEDLERILKG